MCTHIRRDLACGHCKFLVHMFCANNRKHGRRCRRFVIHREYWGNTICRECQTQTVPATRYDAAGFKMPYPVRKRPSAAISAMRNGRSAVAATAAVAAVAAVAAPTTTSAPKSTPPTPSLVLALAGSSGSPSGSSSEFASNATGPGSGDTSDPGPYNTYEVSRPKTAAKSAGMAMQQPLPQIGV